MLLTSGAATFFVTEPDRRRHELAAAVHLSRPCAAASRTAIARAFAAASVLLVLVLVLFVDRPPARPPAAASRPPPRPPAPLRQPDPSAGAPSTRPPSVAAACLALCAACSPLPSPARAATDRLPRRARLRPDRGHRFDLVRADRRSSGSPTSTRNGMKVVYTGGGSAKGRKDFAQNSHRLRRSPRSPTRASTSRRQRRHQQRPRVRLPADRRGRHRVHLPAQDRRRAGPQPAAVRGDAGEDLHQPDHQLERPGDHQGQQRPRVPLAADHAGRPLGRLRHDGAVHDLDGHTSTPSIWRPYFGQSGLTSYYPRKGRVIGAVRLRPGDEHDRGLRRQRHDRLRRVLLPGQQGLPGRQGPQQGRLLRRADAVQRRGRADQGADQPGQVLASCT